MRLLRLLIGGALAATVCSTVLPADLIYSGPQPGEKTTGFKVVELTGPGEGKERDPIAENSGKPTALIFVHTIERSLVPLLRVLDQYGAERQGQLRSEIIFLSADRLEGERRVKAAARSLRLQSRVGLSLDGAEGPGNYGLNKECMMTVLAAKGNQVEANFALVQPGIADAERVVKALARACGDETPPSIEQLSARQSERVGGRDRGQRMDRNTPSANQGEPFPGAVPADPKLNGLMRRFIRPSNDDATVDKVLAEILAHIKDNPDLTRQAVDGWTRILHFGERYGTAYARKLGRESLDRLRQQPEPKSE